MDKKRMVDAEEQRGKIERLFSAKAWIQTAPAQRVYQIYERSKGKGKNVQSNNELKEN